MTQAVYAHMNKKKKDLVPVLELLWRRVYNLSYYNAVLMSNVKKYLRNS
jgi:hypothetical protein